MAKGDKQPSLLQPVRNVSGRCHKTGDSCREQKHFVSGSFIHLTIHFLPSVTFGELLLSPPNSKTLWDTKTNKMWPMVFDLKRFLSTLLGTALLFRVSGRDWNSDPYLAQWAVSSAATFALSLALKIKQLGRIFAIWKLDFHIQIKYWTEAGGLEIQDHPWLPNESEDSLDSVRPCAPSPNEYWKWIYHALKFSCEFKNSSKEISGSLY